MAVRAPSRFRSALVLACACWAVTGCGDDGVPPTGSVTGTGGGGAGGGGGASSGACLAAEGTAAMGTDAWQDTPDWANVTIADPTTCARTYTLSTTGPLRDGEPQNPRVFAEQVGQPVVRTNHDLFDALYALAHEEAREDSVDSISNFAFNAGQPIPCEAGGCFETGRLWTYVWTRDTSYSVALGLALVDPVRAKNSLAFKTSTRRDGTGLEIVQDTGTGGSWPISTDRVVWAFGARALLDVLDGAERAAFRDLAYDAAVGTAERDRLVAYDAEDGLYRGEQSFLDWRENTYPAWTATDTVQIGMSKALGTNVGHLVLLELASTLATENGDAAASAKYAGWASNLRQAIRARLWLEDEGLFSTYVPNTLDPAPVTRFDLLGSALAVLEGVGSSSESARVVASYPHLPKGAPVVWPAQQDVRIYHNRTIWPFVTAYWLKAAAKTGNADAIDLAARSLIRGAAMNLSNMENFEAVSGANWVEEGATSGPVVNSQRQLWSVAGYLSMVHDVVFGLETSSEGIRFLPKLTRGLRRDLFGGASSIALSNLPYKGKRISVKLHLPDVDATSGMLVVESVTQNGSDVGTAFVPLASLAEDNLFEITLGAGSPSADGIRLVSAANTADYKNVFGPRTPSIDGLSLNAGRVELTISVPESPADVVLDVYRDGQRVAQDLPGNTTTWVDAASTDEATRTYCYSLEARFVASGNASQHARPMCWWGAGSTRIQSYGAETQFTANGGTLVLNHGRWHFENWGDPGHTLTIANVTPNQSGRHLLQVVAGNGAGDFTSGITCAVKAIEVWDGATLVGSGQLMMPHLGTWDDWRDSSFFAVDLTVGKSYTVIIREDAASGNMSDLDHFSLYGGTGGTGGRFNRVNIAELKVLAISP